MRPAVSCSREEFTGTLRDDLREWEPIGAGGESGYTAADPLHPGFIFGGTGTRFDLELNAAVPGTTPAPRSTGDPDRGDWTQPLVISRADPRAMYYTGSPVRLQDGRWCEELDADQRRPYASRAGRAARTRRGRRVRPGTRNGSRGVVYTISPSPLLVPMLWVGTDDGLIHVTTTDGKNWQNVTPPAVTAWSRVTTVEASHFDFNSAYASVDRHQLQDFEPYIYRTRDMGKSWQKISSGLPAGVYVHVVKEDPKRQGMLVAGTERGAFVSLNDGDSWQPLQRTMPVTSVRDFEFYENDLIVATHGRGFWVIDDISPLRQVNDAVLAADAHLFKPADAINVAQGGDNGTPLQKDEPQASNPPDGAIIDFYLKSAATGTLTLEILDAAGTSVRTFTTDAAAQPAVQGGRGGGGIPNTSPLWRTPPEPFSASAGMHRVVWDGTSGRCRRTLRRTRGRSGGAVLERRASPETFTGRS